MFVSCTASCVIPIWQFTLLWLSWRNRVLARAEISTSASRSRTYSPLHRLGLSRIERVGKQPTWMPPPCYTYRERTEPPDMSSLCRRNVQSRNNAYDPISHVLHCLFLCSIFASRRSVSCTAYCGCARSSRHPYGLQWDQLIGTNGKLGAILCVGNTQRLLSPRNISRIPIFSC
jgi:hypothetical protein